MREVIRGNSPGNNFPVDQRAASAGAPDDPEFESLRETFNPWLNQHRPCLFATELFSDKGKIIKRYKHEDVKTPLACLELLNTRGLVRFKRGVTLQQLQAQAKAQTDLAAAQQMQAAKAEMFELFNKTRSRRQA